MTQGHFTGVAVVIDDEVGQEDKAIHKIILAIKGGGGHVIEMKDIPAPESNYKNFAGASFFILDWNLQGAATAIEGGGGASLTIPATLAEDDLARKVDFLIRLRETRLAPVFIFTAEPIDNVKAALKRHKHLYQDEERSHIFIMSKDEVIKKDVFQVLNDWIEKHPAALALKLWEQKYEEAKNAMFVDFHGRDPMWPALLWRTFEEDGVPASDELGQVISRNIASRMLPITIDMKAFDSELDDAYRQNPDDYQKTLLNVLSGERFVKKVNEGSIAPGDVFYDGGAFWINIRPDCDCIVRDDQPELVLYLLKGKRIRPADLAAVIDAEKVRFKERDTGELVFAMCGGVTVNFEFKTLYQKPWKEISPTRIGRLLPPYSTRIQQRYASYLQRPGLPKMPLEAMPKRIREDNEKAKAERAAKASAKAGQKQEAAVDASGPMQAARSAPAAKEPFNGETGR